MLVRCWSTKNSSEPFWLITFIHSGSFWIIFWLIPLTHYEKFWWLIQNNLLTYSADSFWIIYWLILLSHSDFWRQIQISRICVMTRVYILLTVISFSVGKRLISRLISSFFRLNSTIICFGYAPYRLFWQKIMYFSLRPQNVPDRC